MPAQFPSFLLKQLYVPGSFRNTPNGFELTLRNRIAPATLVGFGPLQLDGRDIPRDQILISIGVGKPIRASDITRESPQAFPFNSAVHFQVDDQPLALGKHRLSLAVNTAEAGEFKIDAEDTIT